MNGPPDVVSIITGMTHEADSSRKLAVYHLQSLVADPSFADAFVQGDGLPVLKAVVLEENGNTLAYALGSFTRLLDMNMGWEEVGPEIITRAVDLVVTRPVINVLRNALLLLVLVVSRTFDHADSSRISSASATQASALKALKPLLQAHDTFLDALVDKLSSADHVLCANALHLINALMRDSIERADNDEWPRFVVRVQELGVMDSVERLMRGDAVSDLAGPVLEFQSLIKVLFRRWKEVRVDEGKWGYRRALEQLQASSTALRESDLDGVSRFLPDRWTWLGFDLDSPVAEVQAMGFLGMMDLAGYVRRNTSIFQKTLLEQSAWPVERRCPLAKASLSVTAMLYNLFDVGDRSLELAATARSLDALNGGGGLDGIIQPLVLRWEGMHAAVLGAFLRLWKATCATEDEYYKIDNLVKVLVTRILGRADRKSSTDEVERRLAQEPLATVRKWQLEDLDQVYNHAWGSHLRHVRDKLHNDSAQFMREQRIRCLLSGAWFPVISDAESVLATSGMRTSAVTSWRFVQLSPSRRHLHYVSHMRKPDNNPSLQDLAQKIDLNIVSAVLSNITVTDLPLEMLDGAPTATELGSNGHAPSSSTITKLTIYGAPRPSSAENETVLLQLHTASSVVASEWLDGLLMLLNQQPITADTNKLITIMEDWSLKVRMLNLRLEDAEWEQGQIGLGGDRPVPSREGLDADYWYDMGEV